MITDRPNNNQGASKISNTQVVKKFVYLATLVKDTSSYTKKLYNTRIMESLAFPIYTYASECWTLKQIDLCKINSFKMTCEG